MPARLGEIALPMRQPGQSKQRPGAAPPVSQCLTQRQAPPAGCQRALLLALAERRLRKEAQGQGLAPSVPQRLKEPQPFLAPGGGTLQIAVVSHDMCQYHPAQGDLLPILQFPEDGQALLAQRPPALRVARPCMMWPKMASDRAAPCLSPSAR